MKVAKVLLLLLSISSISFLSFSSFLFAATVTDGDDDLSRNFKIVKTSVMKCLEQQLKIENHGIIGEIIKKLVKDQRDELSKTIVLGDFDSEDFRDYIRRFSLLEYADCLIIPLRARFDLLMQVDERQEITNATIVDLNSRLSSVRDQISEINIDKDGIATDEHLKIFKTFKDLKDELNQRIENASTKIVFIGPLDSHDSLHLVYYVKLKKLYFNTKIGHYSATIDISDKTIESTRSYLQSLVESPSLKEKVAYSKTELDMVNGMIISFLSIYAFTPTKKAF